MTTPVVIRNAARVKINSMTSHLDLDDAPHHDVPGQEAHEAVEEPNLAGSALDHRAEVLRVAQEHEGSHDEGKGGQHQTGEPALCRHHLDVALELGALANGVGDVVDHLRHV